MTSLCVREIDPPKKRRKELSQKDRSHSIFEHRRASFVPDSANVGSGIIWGSVYGEEASLPASVSKHSEDFWFVISHWKDLWTMHVFSLFYGCTITLHIGME